MGETARNRRPADGAPGKIQKRRSQRPPQEITARRGNLPGAPFDAGRWGAGQERRGQIVDGGICPPVFPADRSPAYSDSRGGRLADESLSDRFAGTGTTEILCVESHAENRFPSPLVLRSLNVSVTGMDETPIWRPTEANPRRTRLSRFYNR